MKMNHRYFFTVAGMALLTGLVSCDDNENDASGMSKSEAKAAIASFNSAAKTDLQALADTKGLDAANDFFDLTSVDDPFGRTSADKQKLREFLRKKGQDFRSIFETSSSKTGRKASSESFDFEGNKGVYEWNAALEQFEYTADHNAIKILFPTEGSASNNAELNLTAFEDEAVEDAETGEVSYEPTLLVASLKVDGTLALSLDLEVDYDALGFPITTDISVTTPPFTSTIKLDVTAPTKSTLSISLRKSQEVIFATSVNATYGDASKSEESLSSIDGFIQFKNLKLQGSVDLDGADDPEVDFNKFVKLALYSDNNKAGDIIFEDINGQSIPFIRYSDGSKEKLEDVLKPVMDEIDAMTEDLGVNG